MDADSDWGKSSQVSEDQVVLSRSAGFQLRAGSGERIPKGRGQSPSDWRLIVYPNFSFAYTLGVAVAGGDSVAVGELVADDVGVAVTAVGVGEESLLSSPQLASSRIPVSTGTANSSFDIVRPPQQCVQFLIERTGWRGQCGSARV